jgi:hypothetical protein
MAASADRHHDTLRRGIVKRSSTAQRNALHRRWRLLLATGKIRLHPPTQGAPVAIAFGMLVRRGCRSDHHQSARLPALCGKSYALAQTRNHKPHR